MLSWLWSLIVLLNNLSKNVILTRPAQDFLLTRRLRLNSGRFETCWQELYSRAHNQQLSCIRPAQKISVTPARYCPGRTHALNRVFLSFFFDNGNACFDSYRSPETKWDPKFGNDPSTYGQPRLSYQYRKQLTSWTICDLIAHSINSWHQISDLPWSHIRKPQKFSGIYRQPFQLFLENN